MFEQQIFKKIDTPQAMVKLKEQTASIAGKKGAQLLVVSTADGNQLAEYKLDYPPVFDGMAAAGGKLYITTTDGKVLCFTSP